MTRLIPLVWVWFLFGKFPSAASRRVVESLDRGSDRDDKRLQSSLANLLLRNLPLASQKSLGRHADRSLSPRAPQLLSGQSATKGLQGVKQPPQLARPLAPCFVPTHGSARTQLPCMAENNSSLNDEWSNLQADKVTSMGRASDVVKGLSTVWVLISGSGNDHECVYTLPGNTMHVLAFERQSDAERYAFLVNMPDQVRRPVEWTREKLRSLCDEEGLEVALARGGQFLIPTSTEEEICFLAPDYIMQTSFDQGRQSRVRVGQATDVLQGVSKNWVVLINPGQINEGVYTLQNSAKQLMLVFEEREDAIEFANELQAGAGFYAAAHEWDQPRLKTFCEEGSYEIYLVAGGASVKLPKVNEYDVEAFSKAAGGLVNEGSNKYIIGGASNGPHSSGHSPYKEEVGLRGKNWVVLINPGQLNEGVYTLENFAGQHLLVFKKREDAKQFADELQASSGFDVAIPSDWDAARLRSFCEAGGYEFHVVAEGASIQLPEVNRYDVGAKTSSKMPPSHDQQLEEQRASLEELYRKSLYGNGDFQA